MSTISEELKALIDTKKDILSAIIEKGVTTEASAPFSLYGDYVRRIGISEDREIFDILQEVLGTSDEYDGKGGTDEEIEEILDKVLGNSQDTIQVISTGDNLIEETLISAEGIPENSIKAALSTVIVQEDWGGGDIHDEEIQYVDFAHNLDDDLKISVDYGFYEPDTYKNSVTISSGEIATFRQDTMYVDTTNVKESIESQFKFEVVENQEQEEVTLPKVGDTIKITLKETPEVFTGEYPAGNFAIGYENPEDFDNIKYEFTGNMRVFNDDEIACDLRGWAGADYLTRFYYKNGNWYNETSGGGMDFDVQILNNPSSISVITTVNTLRGDNLEDCWAMILKYFNIEIINPQDTQDSTSLDDNPNIESKNVNGYTSVFYEGTMEVSNFVFKFDTSEKKAYIEFDVVNNSYVEFGTDRALYFDIDYPPMEDYLRIKVPVTADNILSANDTTVHHYKKEIAEMSGWDFDVSQLSDSLTFGLDSSSEEWVYYMQ